jgi:hypothetical protein
MEVSYLHDLQIHREPEGGGQESGLEVPGGQLRMEKKGSNKLWLDQ